LVPAQQKKTKCEKTISSAGITRRNAPLLNREVILRCGPPFPYRINVFFGGARLGAVLCFYPSVAHWASVLLERFYLRRSACRPESRHKILRVIHFSVHHTRCSTGNLKGTKQLVALKYNLFNFHRSSPG
jgi:hypothetical protein